MAPTRGSRSGSQLALFSFIAILVLSNCRVLHHANALIVNGTAAEPGEFPFVASIRIEFDREKEQFARCGGAIIHQNYVLSAARCVFIRMDNPSDIRVGLGCHEITNCRATYDVAQVMIYPTYNGYVDNVALLRLTRDIEFNNVSGPGAIDKIELAEEELEDEQWGSLTIAGWGQVDYENFSDILMTADVLAEPHSECVRRHIHLGKKEMCARSPSKFSCYGDSGGALFKKQNGTFLQVGIESGGFCSWTTYYEKVASYRDWISGCTKGRQCATFGDPPLNTVGTHPAAYVILIIGMVLTSLCCLYLAEHRLSPQ